ncbi:MAG TPA: PrsW family intramembrane metalloprotease [Ignavibacteria bacterium]|nr:PrsW family intramembrane metalloprotease [Ignavibacteria bacterium]
MIFFASLFAAVVPMFIYLLILWSLDRNERDPFWMLIINFIWGGTGAVLLAVIGSTIFQMPVNEIVFAVTSDSSPNMIDISGAIITAPVVEEFTKGIFLVIISKSMRFDGVVDGVIYGGAIGLGFGMTENFLYFMSTSQNWLGIVIVRTLFSGVLHMLSQATFGGFVGYAKFKPAILRAVLIPAGYLCAVALHFCWNFSVSVGDLEPVGFLFLFLYMLGIFAAFQIALYIENRHIYSELIEESDAGVLPRQFVPFITSVFRRSSQTWLPYSINKKVFVKKAVTLGLRKFQFKHTTGLQNSKYKFEVDKLRYEIQKMLYDANINTGQNT